jgi:hypothetical protein
MLDDGSFATAGDHAELLDTGGARLIDGILNQGLVHNRQHFLGHGLGGRKETCAETGDGENGLAQRLNHVERSPNYPESVNHAQQAKLWQASWQSRDGNNRSTALNAMQDGKPAIVVNDKKLVQILPNGDGLTETYAEGSRPCHC